MVTVGLRVLENLRGVIERSHDAARERQHDVVQRLDFGSDRWLRFFTGDASLFDIVPSGKTGIDSITASATVTVNGAAKALSAGLSVGINAGAPAKLAINDLGPTPATS